MRKKTKHDPGKRMSDLNYLDDTDTKPSKKAEAFPANTWVFNPNANWRVYWDMTILIFVVYVLFVAPFELAFVSGDLSYQQRTSTIFSKKQRKNLGLFLCNSVADSFFILDLFCTLNTALYNETFGEWILDHAQIVRSYSDSGWLWLDLLSIFPWDEIPSWTRGAPGPRGASSRRGATATRPSSTTSRARRPRSRRSTRNWTSWSSAIPR